MYLKPTSRLSTTWALKCRAMRLTIDVVTSVVTTIGEAGIRPGLGELAQLEVREQQQISLPVMKR